LAFFKRQSQQKEKVSLSPRETNLQGIISLSPTPAPIQSAGFGPGWLVKTPEKERWVTLQIWPLRAYLRILATGHAFGPFLSQVVSVLRL